MGFLDETATALGIDEKTKTNTSCYISFSSGMVIEGYRKICELSNEKISLICEKGKTLTIFGNNLKIKEIAHREISILGTISSVNFV